MVCVRVRGWSLFFRAAVLPLLHEWEQRKCSEGCTRNEVKKRTHWQTLESRQALLSLLRHKKHTVIQDQLLVYIRAFDIIVALAHMGEPSNYKLPWKHLLQ